MWNLVETLENRTLLSAGSAVLALKAEGAALAAAVVALDRNGSANFKLIEADLKAAGELKSSAALLKTLGSEGKKAFTATSKAVSKTVSLISADVKKLDGAAVKLSKKPGNAGLEAKVSAAATALSSAAASRLAVITADLNAQHTTDSANVAALESANPGNATLASNVTDTIGPGAASARAAVETDAATALTTDVNAVVAALTA